MVDQERVRRPVIDSKKELEHLLVVRYDGETDLGEFVRALRWLGQAGASRNFEVASEDPEIQRQLAERGYTTKFEWDGDGSAKIWSAEHDGEVIVEPPPPITVAADEETQKRGKVLTLDRSSDSRDIEYYTAEKLGPRMEKTPEGFLICYDVPVARTGEMIYGPDETPIKPGRDGQVKIHRIARDVFSPKSMASLNGKPVTDDHPPVDVIPINWSCYAKGTVVNPRRGSGDQKNLLLADVIVYDSGLISEIETGKREVSCGYDPQYYEILGSDGEPIPGEGMQGEIIYNHLAFVTRGRCGYRCAAGDRAAVGLTESTRDSAGSTEFWYCQTTRRLEQLSDLL